MSDLSKSIPYGPTYPPFTFDEANWEKDLQLMAQADMNLMRIGDVGTWDQVEAKQGEIDLSTLQRFYDLAQEYGIHILLSTGTCSPPLWLALEHPDVRILSNRGEAYPLGASYHWACIHHPGFLDAAQNYIQTISEFAVQQPNHFGWQVSNEMGFPFNPTREAGDIDLYCYCDHSKKAFQDWLKEKYGSLEALGKAWSWSTTNFVYNSWDEPFPPEALPKTWSGVTRWLDWRLFWQQAFADYAAWEAKLLRKTDPDHPISLNTFNFKGYDRFGTYTGLDQWKISEVVDHIGYDLYPGSGNKLATRPEHNSMFLDHGRSVSMYAGTDFWLHEIESGPINGWLLGPDHRTDEKDILTLCFESLGHNGKALIYMPWREWRFQPLRWGALVDLKIRPTPRYESSALIGKYLKQNADFYKEAQTPKGEVAILEDKSNAIFLRGTGQEDELFEAQCGAYRSFWEYGYRVDFILPKHLSDPAINDYKFICLPLMGLIAEETATALEKYVENGGVVIGFARCGTLDYQGWYHYELPIAEFERVFGLDNIEADSFEGGKIRFGGNEYKGWLKRDLLTPKAETEILGTFEDGKPAVTLSQLGKGFGVYIATQADGGLVNIQGRLLPDIVKEISSRLGFEPHITTNYPEKAAREIDPHFLDTPTRSEIIFTSYLNKETQVNLSLLEPDRVVKKCSIGIVDKTPIEYKQEGNRIILDLNLASRESICIQIDWEERKIQEKTGGDR